MVGKIFFKKSERKVNFRSPSEAETEQTVEFREDPLTGWRSRINLNRSNREKQAQYETENLVGVVEKSKENCPFCPENLERKTPKLPDRFPTDRIERGSAKVFPNLYPLGEFHAVALFSEDHYLGLEEYSPELVKNCMEASLDYLEHESKCSSFPLYPMISWNHLPPSAASIIHPHFQVMADRVPTSFTEKLIEDSEKYRQEKGSNFWSDLCETERKLEKRFIAETENIAWLASYSPVGNNEIQAVFRGVSSLEQVGDQQLYEFSQGICAVLEGYKEKGLPSFNMGMYSGPTEPEIDDYFYLNAKMVSRPPFIPYYSNDVGFLEKFHFNKVLETVPEKVAKEFSDYF